MFTITQRQVNLLFRQISLLLFVLCTGSLSAQQLKIKDFAIWGGSAPANVYNNKQGVFILGNVNITGNIGSNHLIDVTKDLTLKGNMVSGNGISLAQKNTIIGNVVANRASSAYTAAVITSNSKSDFTGNIIGNGKVNIKTNNGNANSTITGKVSVPAPTATNYSGPNPTGGINNTVTLPVLPVMPANTNFDNSTNSTVDIVASRILAPGIYRNLALKGNATLTLSGPGNYVFYAVNNTGANNKVVFDLKGTTTGIINVFVITEANFGEVTAQLVNGNFPQRIYTEVHSKGSATTANAFTISGPNASWIGTVWAPYRNIAIKGLKNTITGALWSGTGVTLDNETSIVYTVPTVVEINVINPYYPPPALGKVDQPNNKIGSELFSLATNAPLVSIIPDNTTFRILGDKVFIEVIGINANDANLRNELDALGMTGIVDNGPYTKIISGYFPINSLTVLNSKNNIQYVRPLYPPLNNATGQAITQGDTAMRADKVRDRFGVDGEGVKVGVLSDSYNNRGGAPADVTEGDLPNDVQVALDFAGNDEGRAMLQIVHDVAPKAKLAFRTGFQTAGDFAQGITDLASPTLPGGKCDVLVDDITYITEPFLRDGKVAEAVNNAVSGGTTYFSSAGNFGSKSYESVFQDAGSNTAIIPAPATLHRFGTSNADVYQKLKLNPGTYTIVLQWSDEFFSQGLSSTGVQTDLDLYLVGTSGYTLFGFNRSNIFGDPFEVCPFTVTDTTEARLIVVRASGNATNLRFKYIIFRGDGSIFDFQNSAPSTIVGHPNADSCIAVGAMLYGNIPPFTPIYPGVASFSSRGGSATLVPGSNTQYTPRPKPNIVAPNGVNTTVTLGAQPAGFNDGDPYPNFFGTSAAAPHAAGVAALLIHARKKFDLQTNVSPYDIRTLMEKSAGKFPSLGNAFNFIGGNGFLMADSAIKNIANARPIIKTWEPAGAALIPNGTDEFPVKVKGAYLTNTTQIFFNGQALSNTVVSNDKTEATGMVPPFSPNTDPAIQLSNASKTTSGLDGGISEEIRFFSTKKEILVRAVNQSRKYSQANPPLVAEIFVDGVPIAQTTTTIADIRLDGTNLTVATNATPESPVGLYGIFPGRTTPLNNTIPEEAAIISNYNFTYETGTLIVGKMNLKITPNNKTIKYGDYIGEVTYNYEFDPNQPGIANLVNDVKALHKKYIADNALAVIRNFNNEETLSTTELANMSTLASFQSLVNARKFSINNGQLRALVNVNDADFADQRFLVDVAARSLTNYKLNNAQSELVPAFGEEGNERALLNVKSLANGTANISLSNGQLKPIVNGQLLAMVNGQLRALVNGQLKAIVNDAEVIAEDYVYENGQLKALVNSEWINITNGQLKAIVNGVEYTIDLTLTNGQLRAIVNGTNGATEMEVLANGQLRAIVNGQLLALVNGQLQALVNGQLMPIVNGQLLALVNGQLQPIVNGQLMALVNGQLMAVVNGQLMALVNGQFELATDFTLTNGQLRAIVNGQLRAIVNGQLKALVNGVITDINNSDVSILNGQLRAIVNGQLRALVNGQLKPIVNGEPEPIANELEKVDGLQLANGQLRAIVNGQLLPIVNGQLRAMVNGAVVAIPNQGITLVNGQLQAMVNGQLQALVNGQLRAIVNGQLQPIVNGDLQPVEVVRLSNGQLRAIVNGNNLPLANGQLKAIVNGQLLAMVNGQLMAVVNGANGEELTFAVFANGQLRALVNGQLQPIVNGQLQPIVNADGTIANGQLKAIVNGQLQPLVNASITNGQLQAIVNNEITGPSFALANGQLRALVNGQLQPIVNNFDVAGATNNTNTVAIIDNNDILLQDGALGGMFAINMITGLDVGVQTLIPGAFVDENFEVTYGLGEVTITPRPLLISADSISKVVNTENPELTLTLSGLAYNDTEEDINLPTATTEVITETPIGNYPIVLSGGSADNYTIILQNGDFEVTPFIDNEAPVIDCPDNISLNLDESGNAVKVSAKIVNNQVIISSSIVTQNSEGGLLAVQNDLSKTLSGSCDCPPGHAVVGYEGRVGEIVDQFKLICAPINSDGSPGASVASPCYNGGTGGRLISPILAPAGSWMVGFGIGDMVAYFNRSGTLSSIEGYSQTYTDVINGSTNRFLNTQMNGVLSTQRTTVEYAPPGSVITGMNYHIDPLSGENGGPFSSTVQFKYQPFVATQELARFAVTDNSSDNLTVNILGNTSFTSANIGTNPITIQVTDASGNSSACTTIITVVDNIAPLAICQPVTANLNTSGTATVTAAQVNNGSTDNSSGPLTYNFLVGNNGGQRTVPVNSGTRDGRTLTGITYTYNRQQQTLTPALAIGSTIDLSSLTANQVQGGNANRFWDLSANTLTQAKAVKVLGDFDLGTALQDCGDLGNTIQRKVTFDAPITPGAGPEIFIVYGGLVNDIQILDINGNVALTIPASVINSGSNVTIGGTAVSSSFPGFYLRSISPFSVQLLGTHSNTQSKVIAIDINSNEVSQIGGIRFGGGYNGNCNYVYEILGYQPAPETASQIVFTSANIGNNPVTLQVTDPSGNLSTCSTNITVVESAIAGRSSQTTTTKTKVKPTQEAEAISKEAIYPNPATSSIKVQLSNEVTSINQINVVDVVGRLQSNIKVRQVTTKLFELNISNLPKGVYIIRAKTVKGDKTFKFVKL